MNAVLRDRWLVKVHKSSLAWGIRKPFLLVTALRDFLLGICFMVVDAQNPDPSPATFPAAAETVPLSCALRASDRNRVSRICVLVKDVSATAHSFSLPFSRVSRPLTNVYSACCPAEKPSGNFTNQRQRWSRGRFMT